MKNIIALVIATFATIFNFTACASKPAAQGEINKKTEKNNNMKTDGKKLVAYFSHTGENYNVGYITEGNTHVVAQMIADATGADMWEITPLKGYPKDSYDECIKIAKEELRAKARPAIDGDIDIDSYDIIFLGYPNWWGEPPMCVFTFIEKHNWEGKTVIPFITHEGSGMGGTDRKIANACTGADVLSGKGLAIQGKVAQENRDKTRSSVNTWLKGLGLQ